MKAGSSPLVLASLFAVTSAVAQIPQSGANAQTSLAIGTSRPGFSGQIVVGNPVAPQATIYQPPVMVYAQPYRPSPRPVYIQVPRYQAKRWSKYCGYYEACRKPVYLVIAEAKPNRNVWRKPWRDEHHHDDD